MGCASSTAATRPRVLVPIKAVNAGRANGWSPGQFSPYHAQAKAAFTAGDENHDGVLDARELYGVLVRLGFFNGVPPQHVESIMEAELAKADSIDRDRRITFEEFLPYFEYLMHSMQQRGAHVMAPAQPAQFYGQPAYGVATQQYGCLLYTSPSPRDQRGSRMPSSA